jgi:SET domain-containing protein
MQVSYSIKTSFNNQGEKIGSGIFSKKFIKKGECIWKYKLNINVTEYDENDCNKKLNSLTISESKKFLDLSYGLHNKLCFINDDGRFINHSSSPYCNCKTEMQTGDVYSLRDIDKGEELLEDYSSFEHPDFLMSLLNQYDCFPSYYTIT